MKTLTTVLESAVTPLYESLLDGEDEIFDNTIDVIKKKGVEQFLMKNYEFAGKYDISDKPNKDGKYVVDVSYRIRANANITTLTNGDFVFGIAEYGFNCMNCKKLTSLEGAPEEVNGDFICSGCSKLTSLEGAPEEVKGNFNCSECSKLTSLEGAPEIAKAFSCQNCRELTTLKGAPEYINLDFDCSGCSKLTSLEGAPKKVGCYFICANCTNLISLEGAPKEVNDFDCNGCSKLTSLEGVPEKIYGNFMCEYCTKLTSLEGTPRYIGRDFYCRNCGGKFTKEDVKKVSIVKKRIYT